MSDRHAPDPRSSALTRRGLLRGAGLVGAAAALGVELSPPAAAAGIEAATIDPATVAATATAKTESTYYTAEKVTAARRNIEQYGWARDLRDSAVAEADKYVALGDEWLWSAVPSQKLPRGYAVNQSLGSPVTGTGIFQYGNYPWEADPLTRPWKITDPSVPADSDQPRVYPTNDFGAYYASGLDEHGLFDPALADRSLLVNELYPQLGPTWGVDDGFGWVDGDGHRWTFIAYYHHWHIWYSGVANAAAVVARALRSLRDAYVYTGDLRYAHSGLILLDRVADIYPAMDTSVYKVADGFLNSDGGSGRGKVLGCIWETSLAKELPQHYDAFFPAIATTDDAGVVPFLAAKAERYALPAKDSTAAIRGNIEDNIVRQIVPAIQRAQIRGNFGTHQATAAMAAVVLDSESESREWIDWIFASGAYIVNPPQITGGNMYATLVGDVDRDGFGNEAAPGYNYGWISAIGSVADILAGYQRYPAADLYQHPKYQRMVAARLLLTMLGRYTPQIGDSGSSGNPGLFGTAVTYAADFARYHEPMYAQAAYQLADGDVSALYSSIFDADVAGTQQRIVEVVDRDGPLALASENLTGYGFAGLRAGTGAAARGLWLYYGRNGGHGHLDALNLGLYGFGVDLLPELGYPEFADSNARRIEWNANTIAHNTVVVDARPQKVHWVGEPNGFAAGERVQLADISAPLVYPQASVYRRVSAMVAAGDSDFYTVDIFRVVGGAEHHFSFHAAAGPATTDGLTLVAQPTGSYAGPDVLPPPDTARPRAGANGFDWLSNVSRDDAPAGPFSVDWQVADTWQVLDPDPDLHLRFTMLSDVDDVALADGIPPRNKPGNPASLRYVIGHRSSADGTPLASQFVSLIEPYIGGRVVRSATTVPVQALDGTVAAHEVTAIKVELADGRVDYIVSSLRTDVMLRIDPDGAKIQFRGSFGVYSLRDGKPEHAFSHNASFLGPLPAMQGPAAATGTLRDFTRELSASNTLNVELTEDPPAHAGMNGAYAYVWQPQPRYGSISFPGSTPSQPGQYGALSQRITVGEADSYHLTVRVNDTFTAATAGYHFIQVLIDGAVVAEQDVAGGGDWRDLTADVTAALAGKTAALLTLRLYERRGVGNFAVTVMFDNVTITGATIANADFEDPASLAWQPEQNAPAFTVSTYASVDAGSQRNAVYRIHRATVDGTAAVLDIGPTTTTRGYLDPNDFTKGFRYDVAEGATVTIPYTRQWPHH